MHVLPYQSQTKHRKAFEVVSTNSGMRGVEIQSWSQHCGQWIFRVPKTPSLCRLQWLWVWRGIAAVSDCSSRQERTCPPLLPALEEMRGVQADFPKAWNTPFAQLTQSIGWIVSTQSTHAIQLFPTPSFHPGPLPDSSWARLSYPRMDFMPVEPPRHPLPISLLLLAGSPHAKHHASSMLWI